MPSTRLARCGLAALAVLAGSASAAPVHYTLDPEHTYPSFEADHGGLSTWRGKFNATTGQVMLDREAGTGTVQVTVDIASVDFGHDGMNAHAKAPDMFDVARYPKATYVGQFVAFSGDTPTAVKGELTLMGVTRPIDLQVANLHCIDPHPRNPAETCGADLYGTLDRSLFGLDIGLAEGFNPEVLLRIQVEAIRDR